MFSTETLASRVVVMSFFSISKHIFFSSLLERLTQEVKMAKYIMETLIFNYLIKDNFLIKLFIAFF